MKSLLRAPLPLLVAVALLAGACSSTSPSSPAGSGSSPGDDQTADAGSPTDDGGAPLPDAASADAASTRDSAAAAQCTATFGTALTNAFGRADGTLLAVVTPADAQCPRPNGTHVILEVTMGGAAYRMVVNVMSDTAPFDVAFTELRAPLAGPSWEDGWHPGVTLDYATTLGLHADAFAPTPTALLITTLLARLAVGAKVSVFATSSGGDSAHLVHRNATDQDGAIVVDPTSASPSYLLFRFSNQAF